MTPEIASEPTRVEFVNPEVAEASPYVFGDAEIVAVIVSAFGVTTKLGVASFAAAIEPEPAWDAFS